MRDLDRLVFRHKVRAMGWTFYPNTWTFLHPDVDRGLPIRVSSRSRREALSELAIVLREARARQRGGRFVHPSRFSKGVRHLVEKVC